MPAACLDGHIFQILPGSGKYLRVLLAGYRALQRKARHLFGGDDDAVIFAAGAFDDVPAIADALGVVDDQRRDGAAARGFLELVGPAAIIGHRPPAELPERILTLRRDEIGVVDQKDRDLALHILPLDIVPAAFGRSEAVAEDRKSTRQN